MICCKEAIQVRSFSFRLLLSQSCPRKVPFSRESMSCGLVILTADEIAGLVMKGVFSDCRECLQFLFIIVFSMSSLEVRVMRLLLSDDSFFNVIVHSFRYLCLYNCTYRLFLSTFEFRSKKGGPFFEEPSLDCSASLFAGAPLVSRSF